MVILPLLLLLLPFAVAQLQPSYQLCGHSGNFALNSTYQANLKLLSSTLPKKAASNTTLFATATVGDAPDMVFALALCRGDTNTSVCEDCLVIAFQDGQQLCSYNKEASLYADSCTLKFSNRNFLPLNTVDENQLIIMDEENFTTSADSVRPFLFTLLKNTAQSAASSSRRFTTSRLEVNSLPTVYCLMQCTPDITVDDCAACLQVLLNSTRQYLDGHQGGRVLLIRCNMRYQVYKFYQGNAMLSIPAINSTTPGAPAATRQPRSQLQPPAAAPPPEAHTAVREQHGHHSRKNLLGIIVVAAPLFIIFSFIWIRRRRKGMVNLHDQAATNRPEKGALVWRCEEKSSEFTLFDFSEIFHATGNFSKENQLGRGGFGPVYKGKLPDGTEVAVKRLASHSGQGFTEFKNEVELIANLQHNNLVKLLGCCIQGEEKLLVYEYLPNKSLDVFIYDGNKTSFLDWNKRYMIIEGIAQGLLYLHKHSRLRIIHRDIKASNILLDKEMTPKISDFGLAKLFSSNDTQGSTKRVVGTYGYMSPEYAFEGIYSIKSDVFSFGVLLLEILSGKRNSGFHQNEDFLNLLGYSWHLWKEGRCLQLLEASVAEEIHSAEARRFIKIALMCVQEHADDRPTMSTVVAMLNNESGVLPEPNHPAYFNLRVSTQHESASVIPCSNNNVTITEEPDGR